MLSERYSNKLKAKLYIILVVLFGIANIYCQQPGNLLKVNEKQVTVILRGFKKPLERVKLGNGNYIINTSVFTIWDLNQDTIIDPNKIKYNDTLQFKIKGNVILFQHFFRGIAKTDYLLKSGDTLKIEFTDDLPNGRLINNVKYKYDALISQKLRDYSITGTLNYTPYEIYLAPQAGLSLYDKDFFSVMKSRKLHAYKSAKISLNNELDTLKAYREKQLISNEVFLMFSDKIHYLSSLMDLQQDQLTTNSITQLLKQNKYAFDNKPYSFIQVFLEAYVDKRVTPFEKTIKFSNGAFPDYREVYNKVENDPLILNGVYKELILYKYLKLINENFSVTDSELFTKRFLSKVGAVFLKNRVYDKYFLEFDSTRQKTDLDYLINGKREKITLGELLNSNKGKLVYIDFWASWCAPCRKAMPDSKKLRDKYLNKKIEFIYIAIDKDFDNWHKAESEEGLAKYKHSYLSVNFSTSNFFNQLQIKSIPRYILYDFNGNLNWKQAAGPSSKDLESRIDELLKQN